jgi:hypothetical protein
MTPCVSNKQGGDTVHKHRVAAVVVLLTAAGSISSPVVAHAATATTFYVNGGDTGCSDSTTDSAVTPYCNIQP